VVTRQAHRERERERKTEKTEKERSRLRKKEREKEREIERECVDCKKRGDTLGDQKRGKESISQRTITVTSQW